MENQGELEKEKMEGKTWRSTLFQVLHGSGFS